MEPVQVKEQHPSAKI